ncbi:MAG TPA: MqnA/MqnD/SBP family protein [Phycisphaerales bacterium]|nr:MqnA/MqnD/SBP family protein [Phycisphaerales bacterium]
MTLTLAHSADADDAFMWWPLGNAAASPPIEPAIDTRGFSFEPIPEDIERLNRRAIERADLDITAVSIRAYPDIRHNYALTSCGMSIGEGYGPRVVSRTPINFTDLLDPARTLAIPGEKTTAFLALRLLLAGAPRTITMPFGDIIPAVRAGRADAGLLIHEGQLTYTGAGLHLIADLGALWKEQTGLPLPLGANAVRRDIDARFGTGALPRLTRVLTDSIQYALTHRARGIEHARRMKGGLSATMELADIDRYLDMYVSKLTLDAGNVGRRAIEMLLTRGHAAGYCPDPGPIDLLEPISP